MIEKLNKVELGGKKFPIKCNINVLIAIQEEFETLNDFEQKILGMKPIKNPDGSFKMITRPDGTEAIDYKMTMPSLKAVAYALPYMIHEGMDQADEQGDKYPEDDYNALIKEADFNIIDTALIMYEEFKRCLTRKKSTTPKSTTSASTGKAKAKK